MVDLKTLFLSPSAAGVHTEFRLESGMVIGHDNLTCLKIQSPYRI